MCVCTCAYYFVFGTHTSLRELYLRSEFLQFSVGTHMSVTPDGRAGGHPLSIRLSFSPVKVKVKISEGKSPTLTSGPEPCSR